MTIAAPARQEIDKALEPLILSASGWRKVFAADGDEESRVASISDADKWLIAAMATAFGQSVPEKSLIFVATDSRPTGPAIADIIIRVLLAMDHHIRYSGVTAVPELLSSVQLDADAAGFAYVSASHNPIGHNGLKFGYSDGGVAGGSAAASLIEAFRGIAGSAAAEDIALADGPDVEEVYQGVDDWKQTTFDRYARFTRNLVSDGKDSLFTEIKAAAKERPKGVVAEMNGSARSTSIDAELLQSAGMKVHALNDEPGKVVHRIVPEGSSLNLCRTTLAELHSSDESFKIGYVPDNDGDRGNLVYITRDGRAEILEAQQVFALSCLSELAYLASAGRGGKRGGERGGERGGPGDSEHASYGASSLGNVSVVANGPTSMRIDRIAEVFGAEVLRAEVGEANVVGLARLQRKRGRTVRFLGEGSNGGNITHPSTCRDPINTLFSIIKLMLLRGTEGAAGPFELWCRCSGQENLYRPDFDLDDILDSIPVFTTTSAYEDRAIMKITTSDHGELKERYEDLFSKRWTELKNILGERLAGWDAVNYEGYETRPGIGNRDPKGPQKGGLKLLLQDDTGKAFGYLWMRGSGTEPVFRILVDIEGHQPAVEQQLLRWHRNLIELADRGTGSVSPTG